MLYWQEFEDIVRALGVRLFGAGLTSFKPGKDGGRDARFAGIPDAWPSAANRVNGKYVLQSKHTGNAVACCSDSDFKTHMKNEVKKVKALITAREMSHYLVFTNRTKSASEDQTFRTTFGAIKGMTEVWLVGSEHIGSLLNDHDDIWDRYEEDVSTPVRFNRADLVKIIHDFSDFMKEENGLPRTDSLRHLKLEEKNKLNGISAPYFSDLQRHSMPQFDQIRIFLSNPRNEEHLDLYRDTADDLRGRLRTMLSEGSIEKLEDGFERVRQDSSRRTINCKGKSVGSGSFSITCIATATSAKMLTPHKHLKLNTSVLKLSALALEYVHRYRSVTYHQLYTHLHRRAKGDSDADDLRVVFGPTVSFLYLLGKIHYHPKNDSFEYLEPAKKK